MDRLNKEFLAGVCGSWTNTACEFTVSVKVTTQTSSIIESRIRRESHESFSS